MTIRIVIAFLLIALAILQYRLWFGDGSVRELGQLKREAARQATENRHLEQRNRELSAEIIDLKQGTEAIEERARNDLGMIKDGETFYQVID